MTHMSCDAKQSTLHQQHCTDLQVGLFIGTCSNCFHCGFTLHAACIYRAHGVSSHVVREDMSSANMCMLNSLFAVASEPAISFSRYCSCLLAAFTFRMPSTYCASADAKRSVSFVASTAYPSTDSPNCSLLRFAARYTDCKRTLLFCKCLYKSRASNSCSGHTVILPHGCAACPLSACKEVCVVLHHVYNEHVLCWRTHSC